MNGEAVLRVWGDLTDRAQTMLVKSSFHSFGRSSLIASPVRLVGAGRISVGRDVYVGSDCWLQALTEDLESPGPVLRIGNGVSISGHTVLSACHSLTIEQSALIARGVYIADHSHRYVDKAVPISEQGIEGRAPVVIGARSWLGQNVVVMPGVRIGTGSVVGANSVVTESVPDFAVAVGAPARVVKEF